MPEALPSHRPLLPAAQVARMLSIDEEEVVGLVLEGRLSGARVGRPPRWRIAAESVGDYLDTAAEEARRMALWRESHAASFPELWGSGPVRHAD